MHEDRNRGRWNRNPVVLAILLFFMLWLTSGLAGGANESWVKNYGPTNTSVYLQVKVDYWNETLGSWADEFTVIDDVTGRFIEGNESYTALDQFFNGKYNTSENFTHGDGKYRVYAAVTDPDNNVLANLDGTLLETSHNFTIRPPNAPPPKVTLLTPVNNSIGFGFRPSFNWSDVIDTDGDNVTYRIVLERTGCFGMSDCLNALVDVDNITDSNYTLEEDLDLDSPYNWTVRAYDGFVYGEQSDTFNYTVMSLVDIELVQPNISVAGMEPGGFESTEDDIPLPFIIRNNGNVKMNVTIRATANLWNMATLGTQYFMFKAGEYSSMPDAFNMTISASGWINMTNATQLAVASLDYNDTTDYAEIEIFAEVPHNEPPGAKATNIEIEAYATK